ncbi:PREDICTED: uncharacterized protein LOC104610678 [Nelumbo nucifera]|uniref:Uncharacterized protein LOC104610678 n=1 Tax=Nelumbo nucifera TaxID=4432 RepID=A0A1U8B7Z6_NELNU|nr:PREDICTED: uncharacterized protein LOC104610678 [Nelumbo nucifera]
MEKPPLSGRLVKWMMQLSEYMIEYTQPRAIKYQAVVDHVTSPSNDDFPISEEIPGDLPIIAVTEGRELVLTFDGSRTNNSADAGVTLTSPNRHTSAYSFKLQFPCSHNIAEYEALVLALIKARDSRAKKIRVTGDSKLVIGQLDGSMTIKELMIFPYRTFIKRLIRDLEKAAKIGVLLACDDVRRRQDIARL